jgi:hypothetical protein
MRLLTLVVAASLCASGSTQALADAPGMDGTPPTARFDDWAPQPGTPAGLIDPYAAEDRIIASIGEPKNPYGSSPMPAPKVDRLLLVDPYPDTTVADDPDRRAATKGTLRIVKPPGFRGEIWIDAVRVVGDDPVRVSAGEHAVQIEPAAQAPFIVYVDVASAAEQRLRFSLTTTRH